MTNKRKQTNTSNVGKLTKPMSPMMLGCEVKGLLRRTILTPSYAEFF